MYEKIPDLPHPCQTNPTLIGSHVVDGMISFLSQKSKNKNNSKKTHILALPNSLKEDPFTESTSKINIIESSTGKSKKSRGKKNGKGKAKQDTSSKEKSNKNEPSDEKKKPCYPR